MSNYQFSKSLIPAKRRRVAITFLRQILGVEDKHPALPRKDPQRFPQLLGNHRYRRRSLITPVTPMAIDGARGRRK